MPAESPRRKPRKHKTYKIGDLNKDSQDLHATLLNLESTILYVEEQIQQADQAKELTWTQYTEDPSKNKLHVYLQQSSKSEQLYSYHNILLEQKNIVLAKQTVINEKKKYLELENDNTAWHSDLINQKQKIINNEDTLKMKKKKFNDNLNTHNTFMKKNYKDVYKDRIDNHEKYSVIQNKLNIIVKEKEDQKQKMTKQKKNFTTKLEEINKILQLIQPGTEQETLRVKK